MKYISDGKPLSFLYSFVYFFFFHLKTDAKSKSMCYYKQN